MFDHHIQKAEGYLQFLCRDLPSRRVGSSGNRQATDFFAEKTGSFGFNTETPSFDCIDWHQEGARLTCDSKSFEVFVSPYSLGCDVRGSLAEVTTLEELHSADITDKLLLMRGPIAQEQLMPKNFPFYNPDHHREILSLLESKQPQAIIAATTQDVGLAGGLSPFPLFEDGDFDIPSVYMTAEHGKDLSGMIGCDVSLTIQAERMPSKGVNVIARRGLDFKQRVVLFAHIDAKDGTPGAIDNATGAVILLLLAESLQGYAGKLGIEIVALNGEDYYDASGEKHYLKLNQGKFNEIKLGINVDGVGDRLGQTAYSLYECPDEITRLVHDVCGSYEGFVEGPQWFQSDHSLFLMHQRPALAFTSSRFTELWTEIAHTPKDTPEIVDTTKLIETADVLHQLLLGLAKGG